MGRQDEKAPESNEPKEIGGARLMFVDSLEGAIDKILVEIRPHTTALVMVGITEVEVSPLRTQIIAKISKEKVFVYDQPTAVDAWQRTELKTMSLHGALVVTRTQQPWPRIAGATLATKGFGGETGKKHSS